MKKRIIFFSVIVYACFLATFCAAAQAASGDEPVSLNFEERPLGEVLAMITKITGHVFIIDAQWLDMPVSISVKATPLHKALKNIFSDINNAIIYRADGKIKILVYGDTQDNGSESQKTASSEEPASSPAAEQESESSQEAAAEEQTGSSVDSPEEGGAQSAEEQESAGGETDDAAAATADEQGESPQGVTN